MEVDTHVSQTYGRRGNALRLLNLGVNLSTRKRPKSLRSKFTSSYIRRPRLLSHNH